MKTREGIFEFMMSMLPPRRHALEYEGEIWLDDNLDNYDETYNDDVTYNERPIRLTFAMLLFCTKGSFHMRINLKDYEVHENELLLITPGSIIDQAAVPITSRLIHLSYAFTGKQNTGFEPMTMTFMNAYKGEPWLLQFQENEISLLVTVYEQMRTIIQDTGHHYRQEALKGCRYIFGAYLANAMERKKQTEETNRVLSRETIIFKEFMKLVYTHYTEHREVSFYADKMCITPKYLSVMVSKASHRTPSEWIRDYVILNAKAMILSGNHSIQQISDLLHFANPSFFGKYFKEAVGCTPGKFADSLNQKG